MVDGRSCSGVLPKGKANAAACFFRFLVPENRGQQNVILIEILFYSKENRKSSICKGSWRDLGGNLTAQTSVKLVWKQFLYFETSFINLKQHLLFRMFFFDSAMSLVALQPRELRSLRNTRAFLPSR